ncbi:MULTISPECIES: hypothetical protein [unclassified Brevibacterium]|uniref:hypothetical protein n=1 Tax=unclassified Brevibacterium TaxID=2614124 RepID=UPI0008A4341A|nr:MULTISPECIES: hypothetical protein [unclassified Brevibacterium]OFL66584.1 hypothetical protein HMPREF2757_02485 [Brevibacterium sp. HMSC063G07]OFS24812.1 hypothetical protein HMPREF3162_10465 [Brevibacterium sp. HMSC07C04]
MTNTAQATARGIRRGIYLSATADTTRLRQLRKQIAQTNHIATAWAQTGQTMRWSMDQIRKAPSTK